MSNCFYTCGHVIPNGWEKVEMNDKLIFAFFILLIALKVIRATLKCPLFNRRLVESYKKKQRRFD